MKTEQKSYIIGGITGALMSGLIFGMTALYASKVRFEEGREVGLSLGESRGYQNAQINDAYLSDRNGDGTNELTLIAKDNDRQILVRSPVQSEHSTKLEMTDYIPLERAKKLEMALLTSEANSQQTRIQDESAKQLSALATNYSQSQRALEDKYQTLSGGYGATK